MHAQARTMKPKIKVNRKLLLVFLFSILVCVIVASYLYIKMGSREDIDGQKIEIEGEEIEPDSYSFTGNVSQLTTPCFNAVDSNCSTRLEWNTTPHGDFGVYIIENFTVPSSVNGVKWGFKAYHVNKGALMPTPMKIYYWNGSSWKQLYALDDQDHKNEVFVETLDMPAEAFSDNKISIKTLIRYSSHTTGGGRARRWWHYVEYFEGKMAYT